MRYFCTYFDAKYLIKGLALYESLKQHCGAFKLFILCLDEETHALLSQLDKEELVLIPLSELEGADPALLSTKKDRTRFEYYCTCTPCLPLWILNSNPEIDILTYLDSDLYFFDSPELIFDELGANSVLVTEHRSSPEFQRFTPTNGLYNVGLLSFRRDREGMDCLQWWRDRCIEWCFFRIEDGKFADQKYLDEWPSRYEHVVVSKLKGANVAPWNIKNYVLCKDADGRLLVDDEPLLFYHFHGFTFTSSHEVSLFHQHYRLLTNTILWVYMPYLYRHLELAEMLAKRERRHLAGALGIFKSKTTLTVEGYAEPLPVKLSEPELEKFLTPDVKDWNWGLFSGSARSSAALG